MYYFIANYGEHKEFGKRQILSNTNKKMLLAEMNGVMLKNGYRLDELYDLKDMTKSGSISDDYGWFYENETDFMKWKYCERWEVEPTQIELDSQEQKYRDIDYDYSEHDLKRGVFDSRFEKDVLDQMDRLNITFEEIQSLSFPNKWNENDYRPDCYGTIYFNSGDYIDVIDFLKSTSNSQMRYFFHQYMN